MSSLFNLKPVIDPDKSRTKHLDILFFAFNFKHNSLDYTVSCTLISISLHFSDCNHLFNQLLIPKKNTSVFK